MREALTSLLGATSLRMQYELNEIRRLLQEPHLDDGRFQLEFSQSSAQFNEITIIIHLTAQNFHKTSLVAVAQCNDAQQKGKSCQPIDKLLPPLVRTQPKGKC